MIRFNNVNKSYSNGVDALVNINLIVNKGDVLGILGASGAGKSTLIRMINGLNKPSSGQVIVLDQEVATLDNKSLALFRKDIGMIFQNFNLLEKSTIFENVSLPIKKEMKDKKQLKERVYEVLALVGLENLQDRYPSQISGGQKQRVAIARAIINNPKILLCDEATSALDPQTSQSILNLLKQLNQKLGLSIVLITHDLSVVKSICNKIAIMDHGLILQEGDIIDVFNHPSNDIVLDYLNSAMQFKEGLNKIIAHNELDRNEKIYHIRYVGSNTTKPIIVSLFEKYQIKTNILYGNVEYVNDVILGNLIITLKGDDLSIKEGLNYLNNLDIIIKEVHKEGLSNE
ncbi:MAG: methionine ABC transporter ATP-binding protein [Bacilli bacterium]